MLPGNFEDCFQGVGDLLQIRIPYPALPVDEANTEMADSKSGAQQLVRFLVIYNKRLGIQQNGGQCILKCYLKTLGVMPLGSCSW